MGAPKPPALAQFVRGKSPYSVENLCATLNWVISCVNFLKGEAGIAVEGVAQGEPRLVPKLVAGDNVAIEATPQGSLKISATGGSSGMTISAVDVESGSVVEYNGITNLRLESAVGSRVTLNLVADEPDATLSIGVEYAD